MKQYTTQELIDELRSRGYAAFICSIEDALLKDKEFTDEEKLDILEEVLSSQRICQEVTEALSDHINYNL